MLPEILSKINQSSDEILLSENELLFIVNDWLKPKIKKSIEVSTKGYMEDIYVKHGLRIKIK